MTPTWTEHGVLEIGGLMLAVSSGHTGWHWALYLVGDRWNTPLLSGPPWTPGHYTGFRTAAEAKADAVARSAAWLEARAAELRGVGR